MKRLFTLTLMLAVAGLSSIQAQVLKRHQVAQQVQRKATIAAGENQAWWGYVAADASVSGLGVQKAETYDCAIFIPGNHAVASGKTINAVRFYMTSTNASDVKVWVSSSLPATVENDAIDVVPLKTYASGINDVALSQPVEVPAGGIYVGYSFTIDQVTYQNDAYPIAITGDPAANTLLLRTSASVTNWGDMNDYGRLYLQVLLEGEFPYTNATEGTDFGEYIAAVGGTVTAQAPVTNIGSATIQSLDYTITGDGVVSDERHVDLTTPIGFGATAYVPVSVSGDAASGSRQKTLTITKVNGVANESDHATSAFTLTTVSRIVNRGIAVEEFTGTGCGWCPRGIVGMERLRHTFGDQFIGLCVHGYNSSDPMYLAWSTQYHSGIFSGSAPSCQVNRYYGSIDPYYGIVDNFEEQQAIPTTVDIDLKGTWNEDSTKVTATATLEGLVDDKSYTIEYFLIADSLTGTTTSWKQANYYSSAYASQTGMTLNQLEDDLKFLWTAGSSYFVTFNDVVIATSFVNRVNKAPAVGVLNEGQQETYEYELTMPTKTTLKSAIKNENVAVAAIVVAADGTITNAAKYYLRNNAPTDGIRQTTVAAAQSAAIYSLDGRRIDQMEKGLNIVRQADGSIRKVLVK